MESTNIDEQQGVDESRARAFISRCTWKVAKTMPWVPHSYVVIHTLPKEDREEFRWFASTIRKYGRMLAWGKKAPKPYWFIDEYKYWVMDENPEDSILINRAEHHV